MIDHLGFGVTDLEASKAFFTNALAPLGIHVTNDGPDGAGFGREKSPSLWLAPARDAPAPVHLAFVARNRDEVKAFYEAALAAGGRDNGAPGIRAQYSPTYYAAFVIGPDGHNVEAVCHETGS